MLNSQYPLRVCLVPSLPIYTTHMTSPVPALSDELFFLYVLDTRYRGDEVSDMRRHSSKVDLFVAAPLPWWHPYVTTDHTLCPWSQCCSRRLCYPWVTSSAPRNVLLQSCASISRDEAWEIPKKNAIREGRTAFSPSSETIVRSYPSTHSWGSPPRFQEGWKASIACADTLVCEDNCTAPTYRELQRQSLLRASTIVALSSDTSSTSGF